MDEFLVNKWLETPVITNNGNQLIIYEDDNDSEIFCNYHFCNDFYTKIKKIITKNGHIIENEEEFKDIMISLIYKYSK